jgi:hypothetical protein
MLWKIGKRKRKGFFFPVGFWPSLARALSPLGRPGHGQQRAARFLFPASRLGQAQPTAWRARAFPFSLFLSLTPSHASGTPSSSPRRRRISFLVHHRSNLPLQSLPSLFRAPPGYIFRAQAPLRSILPRSRGPSSSRGGHARDAALAAHLFEPRDFLASSSASIWPLMSSHWYSLPSGVLLSRAHALYR